MTPLFLAAQEGHATSVEVLLKNGAAVDKARDNPNMHPTIKAFNSAPRPQSSINNLVSRDIKTSIYDFVCLNCLLRTLKG